MRLGKHKSATSSEYEWMVAHMLDMIGVDYYCQVIFRNTCLDDYDVGVIRADFVLANLDIVIEVDDPRHFSFDVQRRDRVKDWVYESNGFFIYRIPTYELDKSPDAVMGDLLRLVDRAVQFRGWDTDIIKPRSRARKRVFRAG